MIAKLFRRKIRIGIDINEVLRSRWTAFDKYYFQEFGEDGIPDQPYVYDFFKHYKWEDVVETTKELKEEGELPEDINPKFYQVDDKGETLADFLLFKTPVKTTLTAKQVYNRFMYEDFVFEIFGCASVMYKGMDLHLKNFYLKYKDFVEFSLVSKENEFTIPSTLSFLSKMTSRFGKYNFVRTNEEMWKGVDILITTDPDILNGKIPLMKNVIKMVRPYNNNSRTGLIPNLLQINDLMNNNSFEKLVRYKNNI